MKGLNWLIGGVLIFTVNGVSQPEDDKKIDKQFMSALSNYVKSTQNTNNKQQGATSNLKASNNDVSNVLQNFLKSEINHIAGINSNPTTNNEILNSLASSFFDYHKEDKPGNKQPTQNLKAEDNKSKDAVDHVKDAVDKANGNFIALLEKMFSKNSKSAHHQNLKAAEQDKKQEPANIDDGIKIFWETARQLIENANGSKNHGLKGQDHAASEILSGHSSQQEEIHQTRLNGKYRSNLRASTHNRNTYNLKAARENFDYSSLTQNSKHGYKHEPEVKTEKKGVFWHKLRAVKD